MNKLKKGDQVQVQLGKDRGKNGTIEHVYVKDGKALISGINLVKRHVRKMQGMEGGIIEIPKPVNLSNIALVCPNCKKLTRIGFLITDTGKVRVCKKCQKEIK